MGRSGGFNDARRREGVGIHHGTSAVVADNLRHIRGVRQISLPSLARQSGVARATLYQMEAGRANPTIDTLFSIATVLGVTLGDLVEPRDTPQLEIIRASEGTRVNGEALEARLIRRLPNSGAVFELYDLTIQSGTRTEAHEHLAGVFEHVLVHAGRLLAGPVGDPCLMSSGDYLCFGADRHHLYEAFEEPVRATLLMEYPAALRRTDSERSVAAKGTGEGIGGTGSEHI